MLTDNVAGCSHIQEVCDSLDWALNFTLMMLLALPTLRKYVVVLTRH
jgi:hypothetical protein